jgi:hypothetical protein
LACNAISTIAPSGPLQTAGLRSSKAALLSPGPQQAQVCPLPQPRSALELYQSVCVPGAADVQRHEVV